MPRKMSRLTSASRHRRSFRPQLDAASNRLEERVVLTSLPDGFSQTVITTELKNPTAMDIAPDGRIFITEQTGQLRVVKDGVLLPTPFLTLDVEKTGERGLVGVVLDPDFEQNQYVYVYYTVPGPDGLPPHNRVSRFTAEGDVALPGSEKRLLELDPLGRDPHHNGGAMHFGPDGKLYIGVGDNAKAANAQSLGTLAGKMLRINADGTIPEDNPFYDTVKGKLRSIWALGLRNPFTFAIQANTGTVMINDVGLAAWEEINLGAPGANYGWPIHEGAANAEGYTDPVYAYQHSSVTGECSITGGVFYEPDDPTFPAPYQGQYFFADHCARWIRLYDPETGQVRPFAENLPQMPVDLDVDAKGNLYFLTWDEGGLYRLQYDPESKPDVGPLPETVVASAGIPLTLTVSASGEGPLRYHWKRNGVHVPGANGPTFTIADPSLDDDGTVYTVVVTNQYGWTLSNASTLQVTTDRPPTVEITSPDPALIFQPGEAIRYSAVASDPEDGDLPPSAFDWKIEFHHDGHVHPEILSLPGVTGGTFRIPTGAHWPDPGTNWYRFYVTVTDSAGLSTTAIREIHPPGAVIGTLGRNQLLSPLPGDQTVYYSRPKFEGWATPGQLVRLFARVGGKGPQIVLGQAKADAEGNWRVVSRHLPNGGYQVLQSTRDPRGVFSGPSPLWPLSARPLVIASPTPWPGPPFIRPVNRQA